MSAIMHFLDESGRSLLVWLVWMNLWTAALLLVAMGMDRLLSARISAGWRTPLYLAIFLRVLLPIVWASPMAWPAAEWFGATLPTQSLTTPLVIVEMNPAVDHSSLAAASQSIASTEGALSGVTDGSSIATGSATASSLTWPQIVMMLYTLIVIGLISVWTTRRVRLSRALASAECAPESLKRLAPGTRLDVHDTIGPAVVGIVRPRIVLPRPIVDSLDRDMLNRILQHEQAHLSRRDHVIVPMLQFILILAWAVAPLWLASVRLRRLMECACDERALRDATPGDRRRYAAQLLHLAEVSSNQPPLPRSLGLLGFTNDLATRIRLLSLPAPRHAPRLLQVVLVGVLAVSLIAGSTTTHAIATPMSGASTPDVSDASAFDETYDVQITLFRGPLRHPAADIREHGDDPWVLRVLPPIIFNELLAQSGQEGMITSTPRMLLLADQPGEVRQVSNVDADGRAQGFSVMVRAKPEDEGVRVETRFTAISPEQPEPAPDVIDTMRSGLRNAMLQPGQTLLLLSTSDEPSAPVVAVTLIDPERVDEQPNAIGPERWNITVRAWDTHEPFPDTLELEMVCFNQNPFWPMEPALPFQISLVSNERMPLFDPVDRPRFEQRFDEWLREHAVERMSDKVGTRTLQNHGASNWTFPHPSHGGAGVERHHLSIKLGRDADEYISVHYRMPDRPSREQFPGFHVLLRDTSTGPSRLIVMPLRDGGRRIILIDRKPYDAAAEPTPQVFHTDGQFDR